MSIKYKCEKCYWKSEAYAYEGDCHYHVMGGKGQCRFIDKLVMNDIQDQYNQRIIEAEQERNIMIQQYEEQCYYDED